jgi:hypothetical protein
MLRLTRGWEGPARTRWRLPGARVAPRHPLRRGATHLSVFVSSGDAGLPAEYPSASPNVISVGGTALHFSGGMFTGETGWSSGGGGCSAYETATMAQSAFSGYGQAGCAGKRYA